MSADKNCANCFYFRWSVESSPYGGYDRTVFHCDHHNLHHGEVTDPDDQYCGDGWVSVKVRDRIKKLDELGI